MKRTFTMLCLVFSSIAVVAQEKNLNFESWEESGNEPPFLWEQPTNWTSSNSLTEWTLAGVSKTDDVQDGDYALRMSSVNISGGLPSIVCLGEPDLIADFENPSVNIASGGLPVDSPEGTYLSLSGHYKFNNNNVLDSAYAVVLLKKYNTVDNKVDTVALGTKSFGEVDTYTSFNIPLEYTNASTYADSIVIAFFSTKPTDPYAPDLTAPGFMVDNLEITSPLGIDDNETEKLVLYPNPASDRVLISNSNKNYALYNANGALQKTIVAGQQEFSVKDLSNGIYYLKDQNGVSVQRVVVSH